MPILVTGGAGYIGSHIVLKLGECGYKVVTYDNLSKGYKDSVLYGDLIQADLEDENTLAQVIDFRLQGGNSFSFCRFNRGR